jgi:serine/threonine protein kinase
MPDWPQVPGYEILGEIARGAMGVVYKARQSSLDRLVALKTLISTQANPHEDTRFLGEAESMAAVAHPNVVQVYDFGRAGGQPFLVLEYLPAGTLTDRLKAGRLYPDDATSLVEKVARGVHAAHAVGVVHRDLKPGNVLFDGCGIPKVGDFGLAKREMGVDLTAPGAIVGTPAYMAPEQATGATKGISPAADVWALGVILYECLCGCRPFDAGVTTDLLIQIANEEPPAVRRVVPSVSRDLETVVQKCLRKNTVERYASAFELAEDLRRVLNREPILARRLSPFARLAGALRRSHEDTQFAPTAALILWLAPVILLTEVAVTAVRFTAPSDPFTWVWGLRTARLVVIVLLVLLFRRGRIDLTNKAEQHLVAVWGGFFAVHLVLNASHPAVWNWDPDTELSVYQTSCALAALAYLSIGTMYWGGFYLIAGAFLALVPLLTLTGRYCATIYGIVWAISLVAIGLHLRQLKR